MSGDEKLRHAFELFVNRLRTIKRHPGEGVTVYISDEEIQGMEAVADNDRLPPILVDLAPVEHVQEMDEPTLLSWLGALKGPRITDVYKPAVPNCFFVSFDGPLETATRRVIGAFGFKITEQPAFHNRWLLEWQPPADDED